MGASVIQPSFTGGELSPNLYARVDLARYQTSARTIRNFISQLYGGITNRPGFRFINAAKHADKAVRLIPFQFSTLQTYVIEVGDLYMRFYKDAGVIEASPGVPVEIVTPYTEDEIFDLKFTQSADVMTITHNDHAPQQLSRTSHTAWTLTAYTNRNGPFQDVNTDTGKTFTCSAASGTTNFAVSGLTLNAGHVGQIVYLEDAHPEAVKPWAAGQIAPGVGSLRRSDGKVYEATAIPGTAGSATGGYRTGGNRPTHDDGVAWDGDTSLDSTGSYTEGVEWTYRHSGFGIIRIDSLATATTGTCTVLQRMPDSVVSLGTYKYAFGAWGGDQGYPACVTYHQERQVFGATTAQPQAYWMTKIGSYSDFGTSIPTVDDDAISKQIPGRQVNALRHFLPIDDLVIMTSGAEFKLLTSDAGTVTPATAQAKPQTYNGSSDLPPLIVGDTALYVQAKGNVVRDLAYTFEKDKFAGNDLTTLASHLFEGKQLVDWTYAQVPHSVIWAVRSDGKLLGLTYLKEQQVLGWHQHDTDGYFESACAISEGNEDALYVVVRREISGSDVRYVERLSTRQFDSIEDSFFVDSGLTYDGRDQSGTLTLSGGVAWDHTETFTATLTVAAITLSASSIGDAFVLTDPDDATIQYRLTITADGGASTCTVRPNRLIPVALRGANTAWDYAIKDVGGLSHLEGKDVSILSDGNVHEQRTVTGGIITLQEPAVVAHVGLPIEADFETLDLNVPGGEAVIDKHKTIPTVRMVLKDTRGLQAGPNSERMYELKERAFENYDEPTALQNGLAEWRIDSNFNKQGRIFVRQSHPLPATILAVVPDATVSNA